VARFLTGTNVRTLRPAHDRDGAVSRSLVSPGGLPTKRLPARKRLRERDDAHSQTPLVKADAEFLNSIAAGFGKERGLE
jgi:hypothetical protein